MTRSKTVKPLSAAIALAGLMASGAARANDVDVDAWMSFRPAVAEDFFQTYDSMVKASEKQKVWHPQQYCFSDYCTMELLWPSPDKNQCDLARKCHLQQWRDHAGVLLLAQSERAALLVQHGRNQRSTFWRQSMESGQRHR
jgi:hypothetical protein